MRIAAIIGLTCLVACSSSKTPIGPDRAQPNAESPPSKAATTTSGTRLKARNFTGEDGSKQFVGWFDSQLNQGCGFQGAADGKIRCLPAAAMMSRGFFADSNCTQALAQSRKGCTPPPYVSIGLPSPDACSTALPSNRIATIGAKHTGAFYAGAPGECTPVPTDPNSPRGSEISFSDFYLVGSDVDPSTFVAATDGHE
jgi:hypothetical protein